MNLSKVYITFLLLVPFICKGEKEDLYIKAKSHYNIDSSIYYLEKFIELPQQPDSTKLIEAYCLLANNYISKSQYHKAEEILLLAKNSPYTKSNKDVYSYVLLDFAYLLKVKQNYPLSLNYYLEAYDQLKDSERTDYFTRCNISLAEYYRSLGQFKEARKYINSAFNIFKNYNLKNKLLELKLYNRAAAIENEDNNIEKSIIYSKKSLKIARDLNYKSTEAASLNEIGLSYRNLKKIKDAEKYYQAAEKLWFSIGEDREAINAMNNRALLYAHFSFPSTQTFELYDSIIDIVKTNKIDYPLSNVYQYLHMEYAEDNNLEKAYKYLKLYHLEIMANEREKNDIEITNIIEKYENKKAKEEIRTVTDKLSISEIELNNEKNTLFRMYLFLSIVLILLSAIIYLAFRLNKSKNKLTKGNNEKAILLKEIHHRVKNNLQIISSLLELQTQKTQDQNTIDVMVEGQNRVQAMALIHKKLYQNDDLAKINFQEYIEELCAAIHHIYKPINKEVKHNINANNISFDIDTAIPLGLILNELITNAYKYGFKELENPELTISISDKNKGNYQLIISDNGKGLPSSFDIKKTKTLGLMLVSQLSRQLFGKYSYINEVNPTFIVDFKDTRTRKLID